MAHSSDSWSRGVGFAALGMMTTAATASATSWSVQSIQDASRSGEYSRISVIGGTPGSDPLVGLHEILTRGGLPSLGIIPVPPEQTRSPEGKIYLYRMGSGSDMIKGFDPCRDRLVILGAASVNLQASDQQAILRLPDGAIISLK